MSFNIVAESNSFELLRGLVLNAGVSSFQIRIGTPPEDSMLGLIVRDIDDWDVPRADLVLGQLRERNLPAATAVFAEQLARAMEVIRQNREP